ncbi:hypothetical protein LXD69_07270 [Flavobacterium sediminilitoris]|uniref:Uncharacterized protein n=1 Tax=Flavobacterium sediminilitoris TaxID=2024526 RepID=A0ABY4HT06_9FLAO|nr:MULTISPECIES: hypothetical protein [Flavobacterium]UOX35311.1 hypothetical protein LXD69_07270 [Flavobacterium sediminilitoris]
MEKHIFLRQVLEMMKTKNAFGQPIAFDLEVRTFNKNNKRGGVLMIYKNAKLLMGDKLKGKPFIEASHFYRKTRSRTNPNHWDNLTRNIELPSGQIKKIKIRYITKFNEMQVVY